MKKTIKKTIKLFLKYIGLFDILIKVKKELKNYKSDVALSRKMREHHQYLNPFNVTKAAESSEYERCIKDLRNNHNESFVKEIEARTGYRLNDEFVLTLGEITKAGLNPQLAASSYDAGYVLYGVLRMFFVKRSEEDLVNIIEIGTSHGFSSTVLAKALEDASIQGKVLTMDILPPNSPIYWNTISDLNGAKTRYDVLGNFQNLIDKYIIFLQGSSDYLMRILFCPRIHIAFIDGSHHRREVIHDFFNIIPFQKLGDLIIADDYNSKYPGIVEVVDFLINNGWYKALELFDTKGEKGVFVTIKVIERTKKEYKVEKESLGNYYRYISDY